MPANNTTAADVVAAALAEAPPLTSDQRARLAELLRPVRTAGRLDACPAEPRAAAVGDLPRPTARSRRRAS